MNYQIDQERRLLIATWRGRHDPLTIQNYVKALMADANFSKGFHYISDQRELETTPTKVSIETGIVFLKILLSKLGPYKYGIVSKKLGTYDLDHLRSLMTHLPEIQVEEFTELDDAIRWVEKED
ncbi:MAG: hypothetical protein GKR91_03630 [Pseudomonadales bacterium]|nr:hypothetical protein [Pseudomonadales bacterium]